MIARLVSKSPHLSTIATTINHRPVDTEDDRSAEHPHSYPYCDADLNLLNFNLLNFNLLNLNILNFNS